MFRNWVSLVPNGDARVCRAPIRPGNLVVHWPEGSVLIGPAVDPDSFEPDYNAVASVEIR